MGGGESVLILEMHIPSGPPRRALLGPGDQEGSISHNAPDGRRDVIMFACHGDYSVIRRSAAGADYEAGRDRVILTDGTEELARLGPGESFVMDVVSDSGIAYRVRWSHSRSPAITCPACGMTSYQPQDIENGYCGNCHAYTSGR
jgi:hypothetical protein